MEGLLEMGLEGLLRSPGDSHLVISLTEELTKEPKMEEPKKEPVLTQPEVLAGLKTPRMAALAKSF